jgi:hypothetical protein
MRGEYSWLKSVAFVTGGFFLLMPQVHAGGFLACGSPRPCQSLGLYESGSSNSARFDRAGISFLFCNIHPEMSAVVIAVPTPYYSVTDATGHWSISNVPNGRYRLHVWYERSSEEALAKLQTDVVLSADNRTFESIRLTADAAPNSAHKNKYGKDYVPPSSPAYALP